MTKRNIPETSKETFQQLDLSKLREIHQKILKALDILGSGTYQEIANYLCMEESRVWKRLSELGRLKFIYRPGTKKVLKSGRMGFIWFRTGSGMPKTDKEAKKYTGRAILDHSQRKKNTKNIKQLDLL